MLAYVNVSVEIVRRRGSFVVRFWLYLCCVCTLLYVSLLWYHVVYSSMGKMYVNLVCLVLWCVTYWYGELCVVTCSGHLLYTLWYLTGFLHMSSVHFAGFPGLPWWYSPFLFCFRGGENSPTEGMFNWVFHNVSSFCCVCVWLIILNILLSFI